LLFGNPEKGKGTQRKNPIDPRRGGGRKKGRREGMK
jgi:hypothetical protein